MLIAQGCAETKQQDESVIWRRAYNRNVATMARTVEEYVFHKIVTSEDFGEDPIGRIYSASDLDGDEKQDLVVCVRLHPVDGADHELYYELLTVLSSAPSKVLRVRIGRERVCVPIKLTGMDRSVLIEYAVWSAGDAGCCPSQSAIDRFSLVDEQLTLSPAKTEANPEGCVSLAETRPLLNKPGSDGR